MASEDRVLANFAVTTVIRGACHHIRVFGENVEIFFCASWFWPSLIWSHETRFRCSVFPKWKCHAFIFRHFKFSPLFFDRGKGKNEWQRSSRLTSEKNVYRQGTSDRIILTTIMWISYETMEWMTWAKVAKHGSLTERVKNQCSHAKRDNTIFEYQTPSARRGKMEINGSSSSHLRKYIFSTF